MPARNSRHAIVFVAVALLFVIGTGTALLLDRMRQTAREAADGVVQRAASVVESTVNRLFLQIDGTLASLPALVGPLSRNREADADEVSRVLRSINFQNLNFRDLLLVRPDGVAWASAQASSRDRPLPIDLPDTGPAVRSGAVSIAGPVQNPTTGEWALFFVRPVRAAGHRPALCRGGGAHPAGRHPAKPRRRGAGPAGRRDADGWPAAGRPAA